MAKKVYLESYILEKVEKGTNTFTNFLFGIKVFPKTKRGK